MKATAPAVQRCALYARYSSENQKESSIIDQVRECTDKANSLGMTIDEDLVFTDRAKSGKRSDNRPGYLAMLDAAAKHEFTVLFVFAIDRLGRDDLEPLRAIKELERLGVRIITKASYDSTMGESQRVMVKGFEVMQGKLQNIKLRENVLKGLTGQAMRGFWCGGRCYGYQLVEDLDAKRPNQYGKATRIGTNLRKDPKQAKIVV